MLLSICIPTYNRVNQLDNCLNSILISKKSVENLNFEVCISDNNSQQRIESLIEKYKNKLNIKFNKNVKNLGFALNGIKSVEMASGTYSWMIGDDDLILPKTLTQLKEILENNTDVDYFFINSYNLHSKFLKRFSSPFDTKNLDFSDMKTISKQKSNKKCDFWDVIDPKISWDFLIGIYLNLFKTKMWLNSLNVVNKENLNDSRVWSNFDNTCLNPIVISNAFKESKVFICAEPLSVNLTGEREWKSMYEFVEIIRIPELLDYYRSQGLSFKKYIYCKNFALRNFSNYLIKILIGGDKMGRKYLNLKDHILKNLLYPNVYLSVFNFVLRQAFKSFNLIKK